MRCFATAAVLVAALGCSHGADEPRANYIFATSSLHTGAFGGPKGADAICAQTASDAGLDGTFVAWIAGTSFDRLAGSRGWMRVDGVAVADRPEDFLGGALLDPIAVDETGHPQRTGAALAWTGIASDGSMDSTCASWTSNAATANGTLGSLEGGGTLFDAFSVTSCDRAAHLLCLELGRNMPVGVARASGRNAFITVQSWLSGAGITDADLVCQADAQQAGLAGNYLAVLPTSTASAASRFDLTGPPWNRIDGALLAPTAAQLFTDDYLATFVNQHADGSVVATGTYVYAGEPVGLAFPTLTCSDWTFTMTSVSIKAILGSTSADHVGAFGALSTSCANPEHLLCLER